MVKKKIEIDTKPAVKSIKDLVKFLDTYNKTVGATNQRQKELNRVTSKTNTRLDTLNSKTSEISKKFGGLNTRLGSTSMRIGELRDQTKKSTTSFKRLQTSSNAVDTGFRKVRSTLTQFNKTMSASQRRLDKEKDTIKNIVASLRSFDRAMMKVLGTVKAKNKGLGIQTDRTRADAAAMRDATAAAKRWFSSMRRIRDILFSFIGYSAITEIAQQLRGSVTDAKAWSKSVSEIKTIQGEVEKSTKNWTKSLRNLSNLFGEDFVIGAEASYQALSNQVVNSANAMSFLREEGILATTTVSSLDDAVQATTGVINAFGLEASSASRINSLLFKTVEEGRVRLSEMANSLGRVSILSKQLNITFKEQQGALARLTLLGLKTDEAMTALRNVQLRLIKPTERMKTILDGMGFSSGQAAIKTLGLVGVMDRLLIEAANNGDVIAELGEIFGRLRGIVGAAGLGGEFNALKNQISEFSDASEKKLKAFEEITSSTAFRADQQIQRFKNSFVENFGQPVLETIVKMVEGFGGADVVLPTTIKLVKQLTIAWVAGKAAVISTNAALFVYQIRMASAGKATVSMSKAQASATLQTLRFNAALGVIGLTVGIATFALSEYAFAAENAALRTSSLEASFQNAFSENSLKGAIQFQGVIDDLADDLEDSALHTQRQFGAIFANLTRENMQLAKETKASWEEVNTTIQNIGQNSVKSVTENIRNIKSELQQISSVVESRKQKIFREAGEARVDEKFFEADQNDEFKALEELASFKTKLNREAKKAIDRGDLDTFDQRISQIEKVHSEQIKRIQSLKREAEQLVKPGKGAPEGAIATPANAELAAELGKDLITLEKQRLELVRARHNEEREFIQEEKQRARDLKEDLVIRQVALKSFQDTLASLDAFKGADVTELQGLIKKAQIQAQVAGVSPKEQLSFIREAKALEKELTMQNLAAERAEQIKLLQQRQIELEKFQASLRQNVENTLVKGKQAIPDVVEKIGKSLATLEAGVEETAGKQLFSARMSRIFASPVPTKALDAIFETTDAFQTQLEFLQGVLSAAGGAEAPREQLRFAEEATKQVADMLLTLQETSFGLPEDQVTKIIKDFIMLKDTLGELTSSYDEAENKLAAFERTENQLNDTLKQTSDRLKTIVPSKRPEFQEPIKNFDAFKRRLELQKQDLRKATTPVGRQGTTIQNQRNQITFGGITFNMQRNENPEAAANRVLNALKRQLKQDPNALSR